MTDRLDLLRWARTFTGRQWANSYWVVLARRHPIAVRGVGVGALMLVLAVSHSTLRAGVAALGILTLLSVGLLIRLDPLRAQWVKRLFLCALVARVVVSVLLYLMSSRVWISTDNGWVQNGGFFVGDSYVYAFNGQWLADQWRMGLFPADEQVQAISMSKSSTPFNYWVAAIIYWLGYHPLTLFFVSCLLGAWGSVLLYWIARLYLEEHGARLAGLLGACWPSLFLWSTQNLKEPLSVFLLLTALYCWFVPAGKGWLPVRLLGVMAAWWLNLLNRFIGPLLTLAILLVVLLRTRWFRALLAASIVVVMLMVAQRGAVFVQDIVGRVDAVVFSRPVLEMGVNPRELVRTIEYMRRVRMEDARTPFLPQIRLEQPVDLLRFLPIGVLAVLTVPTLWGARSPMEYLGAFEMLLWYPLMFFALKGIRRAMRSGSGHAVLLITTLVMCTALGLLEGNVGTLFRHRAAAWPFLLFFAASGLDKPTRTGELH